MGNLLNGTVDWNLIFTALLVIFGFFGLLMEYYYRVHRPREKDKEQKRNGIYKQLLNDIDTVLEKVDQKEPVTTPFNWKTVEGNVSTKLYDKFVKLYDEVDYYHKLLQHCKNFVRFKGFFYLKNHLSELEEEFRRLGVGALEYDLYDSIMKPLLQDEKITLRWLEEKKPELYANLEKCPSYKKLKNLLDWLNEENPCFISLRKIVQNLLNSAENLKAEVKSF